MSESKLSLIARVFGGGEGTRSVHREYGYNAAPNFADAFQAKVLGNSHNTITVPTGARGVIIEFADGSTVTKSLRGATGDTGIALDVTGIVVIPFGSTPPASFVITTNGADTGNTTKFLFF